MADLVMQCAWCPRRYDDRGWIGRPELALSPAASHGVCHHCHDTMLRREVERCAASGDVVGALQGERDRLHRLVDHLRHRYAARLANAEALQRRSTVLVEKSHELIASGVDLNGTCHRGFLGSA